ncbi:MAG TPA: alpha/beta hydrolase domain-containing protein [Vicinamibacteria bacterium]|nr:alpha/beta hydrolase domain-containing protein [Vicinamibacteria bacterium]
MRSSLCAVLLLLSTTAEARVVRLEVTRRADLAAGQAFGAAGPYEKLVGRIHCAVRPEDPHDRAIVDLALAPRNAAGEVEFAADFFVLRPKDPARGNGSLLLEIPNRGGKAILAMVNQAASSLDPESAADLGDGFLMRNGFTVAWVGWQWDVRDEPHLMRLFAPVATDHGRPIRGLLRDDFTPTARSTEVPLGHQIGGGIGGTEYEAASPASPRTRLTVRDAPLGERQVIPPNEWSFTDARTVRYPKGFEPGRVYELVYEVRDPRLAGLGFAAVRDFVSYLKHAKGSVAPVRVAHGVGISQSGRFLRHFLYQGFNADEEGRRVFDGLVPHVAGAGRGNFNHRFCQPSRDAQPMNAILYATDLYPFADLPLADPVSGTSEGLLDRALAEGVAPKILYTNTSYEYWGRAASLVHTTPDGRSDAPLPPSVRVYLYTGLQHFSGPFPPARGKGELASQYPQSPLAVRWFWRAMLLDLDAWVKEGAPPPPSRYPRLDDGTLVPLDRLAWPRIPGVEPPRDVHRAVATDFGPDFARGIVSRQPPGAGPAYPSLVPQVDADGNEVAGVRLPELAAPLATCTGWNLRDPAVGAPFARVSFLGSYFPFSKDEAARAASGDPRRSLAERYGDEERYLGRFTGAALALARERFLLDEDLPAILRHAREEWAEAVR